jgi:hypothetical protein
LGRNKLVPWVLVAEAAVCLLIWRSVKLARITETIAIEWCVTSFAASFVLVAFTNARRRVVLLGVVAAAIAADIADIAYDVSLDPTSHNLFPLELMMTGVISIAGAAIGLAVGSAFRLKAGSGSGNPLSQ